MESNWLLPKVEVWNWKEDCITEKEGEGHFLFNDALNTFYIFKPCLFRFTFSLTCFKSFCNLLPIHYVYFRSEISFYRQTLTSGKNLREREMFYLTTHSTHFTFLNLVCFDSLSVLLVLSLSIICYQYILSISEVKSVFIVINFNQW